MAYILLIDDNAVFVASLAEALRDKDSSYRIDTALSAKAGLRCLALRDYHLVMSDLRMPGLDGLALLKECKSIQPDTPVILITGYGDREIEADAIARGAYAFIHKPVDPDVIHSTVTRALLRRAILNRGGRLQWNPSDVEATTLVQRTTGLVKRIHDLDDKLQQLLLEEEHRKKGEPY